MPCNLIEVYRRFGGSYCLHLQGRIVIRAKHAEYGRKPAPTSSYIYIYITPFSLSPYWSFVHGSKYSPVVTSLRLYELVVAMCIISSACRSQNTFTGYALFLRIMSEHSLLIIKMLNIRNGNTVFFLARKKRVQYAKYL
jgi:hypothetical protein